MSKGRVKQDLPAVNGRIWLLGDSVNTDDIVPSRVLTEQDEKKLLSATLELLLPEFASSVRKGDVIVAGRNFGCGSSREEAVYVLKRLGVGAIVAKSFSRIFFRNCINLGLPPITLKEDFKLTQNEESKDSDWFSEIGEQGQEVVVDFSNGIVKNQNSGEKFEFSPYPPFIKSILASGGLIPYLRRSFEKQ